MAMPRSLGTYSRYLLLRQCLIKVDPHRQCSGTSPTCVRARVSGGLSNPSLASRNNSSIECISDDLTDTSAISSSPMWTAQSTSSGTIDPTDLVHPVHTLSQSPSFGATLAGTQQTNVSTSALIESSGSPSLSTASRSTASANGSPTNLFRTNNIASRAHSSLLSTLLVTVLSTSTVLVVAPCATAISN